MSKTNAAPMATDRLPDTIADCHRLIGDLYEQQAALMLSQRDLLQRLGALEERLKIDSRNSSKPPSSDGPGAGGKRSKPTSGRKRGAQPGHKGHYRAVVPESELDRIVDCLPPVGCACGGALELHGQPHRHQVFELPKLRPLVTEYRCHGGRCPHCNLSYGRGAGYARAARAAAAFEFGVRPIFALM